MAKAYKKAVAEAVLANVEVKKKRSIVGEHYYEEFFGKNLVFAPHLAKRLNGYFRKRYIYISPKIFIVSRNTTSFDII